MKNKTKGTILVLICVLFWGLTPAVAKSGQNHLDNYQLLFWSSLISFVVVFLRTWIGGDLKEFRTFSAKEWLSYSFLGFLGTFLFFLLLYLGYSKSHGMEVLVVQYTWPFQIIIFSTLILKEKLTFKKLMSVGLGFTGVVVVFTHGSLSSLHITNGPVLLLVLLGSASFSIYSVLSKKVTRKPTCLITLYFLVATVASFISMVLISDFAVPAKTDMTAVLLNGILVNGFSFLLWQKALNCVDASYLAPFTFITPALSTMVLVLFYHEQYFWQQGLGIAVIILGGLVNSFSFPLLKERVIWVVPENPLLDL